LPLKYFDVHCHVFPDAVAPKAVAALTKHYGLPWECTGTFSDLSRSLKQAGIDKAVVLSSATRPDQVEHINDYLSSFVSDSILALGTLHPDYPDCKHELKRMMELGLSGLKFHSDFLGIPVDDIRMMRIFEIIPPDMPVMLHAGDEKLDFSAPRRIANVLDHFPHLNNVIAAHMGGYSAWDEAWRTLVGRKVWFDTSSTFWKISAEKVKEMVLAHGVDRILFGTDYPAVSHVHGIADTGSLDLPQEQLEMIFYKNAERLFHTALS